MNTCLNKRCLASWTFEIEVCIVRVVYILISSYNQVLISYKKESSEKICILLVDALR